MPSQAQSARALGRAVTDHPVPRAAPCAQVHVAGRVARGEQLTRNYIPSVASAPAAQRQAALREAGYEWTCGCARCRLEAQAGPAVQEALQVRCLALLLRRPGAGWDALLAGVEEGQSRAA